MSSENFNKFMASIAFTDTIMQSKLILLYDDKIRVKIPKSLRLNLLVKRIIFTPK